LDRRANQLAHHLRGLGVGPESRVGLYLDRSPHWVMALLAVLKAGGAYIPFDITAPLERLAYLLQDAQPQLVLTQRSLASQVAYYPESVLDLDRDWPGLAHQPDGNPPCRVTPAHLVYIIYTSGSTGRPKGVLVEHGGLANVVAAQVRAFRLSPASRVLQFVAPAFDAAQAEVFRTLTAGATLCLAPAAALLPGAPLAAFLRRQAVTAAALPPSALAALPSDVALPALATLVVAGEACPPALAARWARGRRLLNAYGPTEATVCATIATGWDTSQPPPLGEPIAHTQAYVLDDQHQPVPAGVVGELYLGGVGVARGYLGRPDLTAACFVPDAFGGRPGARLYKTGDRARRRVDGKLEFVGRADDQVKVRGFRVELGEIEAVLAGHSGVRQGVVAARADGPGGVRLVGYVVVRGEAGPSPGELRRFLRERLPEYMVPSAWVVLPELPRLANGKVDRKALPALDPRRAEEAQETILPQTQIEKTLADIWAEVLRLEGVGTHDNFFELGGDSILSIQVVARANQAGLHLTAKSLFRHQTIVELAAAVAPALTAAASQGPVTGPVPLTPIQHWFFEQNLTEPQLFNQALMLALRQPLDPALLDWAWRRVQEHHDALRLRFVRTGTGWRQVNAGPEAIEPLVRKDLSGLAGTEQQAALAATATALHAGLNLSEGPLARAALFDQGPGRPGRFLLTVHHVAIDAVSWRVVLEDLLSAYEQLRRGAAVALPPKTTSYQQWAEYLTAFAQSEAVRKERDYWLAPARSRVRRLPVDFPDGANTRDAVDTVLVMLGPSETEALLQETVRAYRTQINDILLTALARAFARWTGQPRLLIELEMHGREEIESGCDLSRTVGWFTAFCPVLLDVGKGRSPIEAVKAVKEQLRTIPNRGLGYGLLRYANNDPALAEALRALPAAEVSFNYLGQMDGLMPASAPWVLDQEGSGLVQGRHGRRHHLLEINALVRGRQLQVRWAYSTAMHRRATVERLAAAFREELRALITHLRGPDARGFTPSDFPDAELSQSDLDKLLSRMD
jgi:amino acid adenylation domain-containing protein/non-ribosomal peptide synthase protein (TIGR01720 family)